jgi:isochorismate synthase
MKERVLNGQTDTTDALWRLTGHALTQGDSLALWRMPDQHQMTMVTSSEMQPLHEVMLEELPAGFLVAAFDITRHKFFLPADAVYRFGAEGLITGAGADAVAPEKLARPALLNWHVNNHKPVFDTAARHFTDGVSAAVSLMEQGSIEKVVLSRVREVHVPAAADPLSVFQILTRRHPNAFVSLVSSPQTGTWLGATPEVLVSQTEAGIFHTVALAGTQPYVAGSDLKKISWTQKDIEEQALVSRYIINCFKKIRLREYEEHGPRTYRAGNLLHLKTDFMVDTRATHFPQLASVMLKLLHPTSAVCGMPLDEARSFLNSHEKHDRELYCGFLGPVNTDGATDLFVNLRCMQWLNDRARLYAGAGITAGSDPAAEWHETEMKLNTILKALSE